MESNSTIDSKAYVISYFETNMPSSPEELYNILYTFKYAGDDVSDILDLFCNHYGETLEISKKMVLEYRQFYREKKSREEIEAKEAEEQLKLEELRSEMESVSSNPVQFKKLDILRYIENWSQRIKPKAPIPKISNFMDYDPVKVDIILKIGEIEIPKGITCCIHAPGGTGKSILLQRVVMASGVRACYISGEDSSGIMAMLLQPYKPLYSNNNADFAHFDNQDISGVMDYIYSSNYDLYVIDPLSSFCTGEKWGRVETENGVASELLRLFNGITAKMGKTILYTHHESKSSTDIRTSARGASALVDNARMGISINRLEERYRKAHSTRKNKFEENEEHTRNVRSFQRELTKTLSKYNYRQFRSQEIIGVIELVCHKNNYGKIGGKASFILTAQVGRDGLNVVPADKFDFDIRQAVIDSFTGDLNV